MNILVTGGSGFLGGIICRELRAAHGIISLGREASNDVVCDLTRGIPRLPAADLVVHAAGLAHTVPRSSAAAQRFFDVNTGGTKRLLQALTPAPPRTLVLISTVAVYGRETGDAISEEEPIRSTEPYGRSKHQAETATLAWGARNKVNIIVLRLPLIAGPNPPGNLGALIRAIRKGYYLRIGSGEARRSLVCAADIARLIPALEGRSGTYHLTDGCHPSVAAIDTAIALRLQRKIRSVSPYWAGKLARIGDLLPGAPFNSRKWEKLTRSLTFSDDKARRELGWQPRPFSECLFEA